MIRFNKLVYLIICAGLIFFSSCKQVSIKTGDNFDDIELPDGSVVYLNHNTTVRFNKKFENRNIELVGEAFFNIVSDENPFVINTKLGNIEVIGTEFNVKTDKNILDVEVEKGRVEIHTKKGKNILNPGKHAQFIKNKNQLIINDAQFKCRIWIGELKLEFKRIVREVKHSSKHLNKEFKRSGKKVGREFKKAGKEIKKETKKLKKKQRN